MSEGQHRSLRITRGYSLSITEPLSVYYNWQPCLVYNLVMTKCSSRSELWVKDEDSGRYHLYLTCAGTPGNLSAASRIPCTGLSAL